MLVSLEEVCVVFPFFFLFKEGILKKKERNFFNTTWLEGRFMDKKVVWVEKRVGRDYKGVVSSRSLGRTNRRIGLTVSNVSTK